MRILVPLAGLLLAGLAAAPPAAACHPSLQLEAPVPGVGTVTVFYDPGCPHDLPPALCARVEWQLIPAPPTEACAPGP